MLGCQRTYNQWAFVVLLVLFIEEEVDAESRCGVEEGKDSDGDKELGRGRVVADQEDTLRISIPAGRGVKILLMESEREEKKKKKGSEVCEVFFSHISSPTL